MQLRQPWYRARPEAFELLRALDTDSRLAGHYRLDAIRGHLEMIGDYDSAIKHYRIAAGRTTSISERNYLMKQGARLAESGTS